MDEKNVEPYFNVPKAITYDEELNIYEQSLLSIMYLYYNHEKGYAYPSYSQLMARSKIKSKSTFLNTLNSLVKKKYIKKETIPGKGCQYYLKLLPGTDLNQVQNCTRYKNVPPPGTDLNHHLVQNCTTTKTNTKTNTKTIYEEVIDYLNKKVGTDYKSSTKKYQTLINARLREKYTIDDFKMVIDCKCNEWKNTPYRKYLTPSTLFSSTHFIEYLEQAREELKQNNKDQQIKSSSAIYQKVDESKLILPGGFKKNE